MHWDLRWPSAPAEPINQIPFQSSQSTLQLMGWKTMQCTLGGGKAVWMTSPLSSVPLTPVQILSTWPRVTCTMWMCFSAPHLHFWVHTQAIFGSCGLLCTLVSLILSELTVLEKVIKVYKGPICNWQECFSIFLWHFWNLKKINYEVILTLLECLWTWFL